MDCKMLTSSYTGKEGNEAEPLWDRPIPPTVEKVSEQMSQKS